MQTKTTEAETGRTAPRSNTQLGSKTHSTKLSQDMSLAFKNPSNVTLGDQQAGVLGRAGNTLVFEESVRLA